MVDGDQLTCAVNKNSALKPILMAFCPLRHFIDRGTGYIQNGMTLTRDYAAIHSYMWEITQRLENFLNDPDGDSAKSLADYGIDFLRDQDLDSDPKLKKVMQHMNKNWQMQFFDMFV